MSSVHRQPAARRAICVTLVVTACATTPPAADPGFPPPPTDAQLKNGGSPTEQEALLSQHGVAMRDDEVVIGGVARRWRPHALALDVDPAVRNHLVADPDATAALSPSRWNTLGRVGLGLVAAAIPLILLGVPLPLLVAAAGVGAQDVLLTALTISPLTRRGTVPATIIVSAAFTCIIVTAGGIGAAPAMLALFGGVFAWDNSRRTMKKALRQAALAYNRHLVERIRAGAPASPPAAPPPAATSPPPGTP